MKPTPELIAQCLTALMANPQISAWVTEHSTQPGRGGSLEMWTNLATEYAERICQICCCDQT